MRTASFFFFGCLTALAQQLPNVDACFLLRTEDTNQTEIVRLRNVGNGERRFSFDLTVVGPSFASSLTESSRLRSGETRAINVVTRRSAQIIVRVHADSDVLSDVEGTGRHLRMDCSQIALIGRAIVGRDVQSNSSPEPPSRPRIEGQSLSRDTGGGATCPYPGGDVISAPPTATDQITALVAASDDDAEGKIPLILIHGIHGTHDIPQCIPSLGGYPVCVTDGELTDWDLQNQSEDYWAKFKAFFANADNGLKDKFKLYVYYYFSDIDGVSSVQQLGESLRNKIDNAVFYGTMPDSQIVLLAHSMGGLVARSYMEQHQHLTCKYGAQLDGAGALLPGKLGGERVLRLITLATPHHGSPLANDQDRSDLANNAESRDTTLAASWAEDSNWIEVFIAGTWAYWTGAAGWDLPQDKNNRSDLRWDNYDGVMGAQTNEKNSFLNALGTLRHFDPKIVAYYGSLDKNSQPYEYVRSNIFIPGKTGGPAPVLLGATFRDADDKLTRVGVLMNWGLATSAPGYSRPFEDNDGFVPATSASFEGHDIGKRIPCIASDHLQMKDGTGGSCGPGNDPYSAVAADLKEAITRSPGCDANVRPDHWQGQYYSNTMLDGIPVMIRDDGVAGLPRDWAGGSPQGVCSIGNTKFSVRWKRTINISEDGKVRFSVVTDDGMRLYVDGAKIIDQWFDQPSTTYTGDIELTAGAHNVVVEYYQNDGGATASVSWQQLNIDKQNSTPVIDGIVSSPDMPAVAKNFSLSVTGSNFDPATAQIVITGTNCSPCTVPNGVLTTKTSGTITGPVTLNNSGSFGVSIKNVASGLTSNGLSLIIP